MPSPFSCNPVIREWLWKKNQIKKKKTREEDFPFDISQTREKFKKCINICREAAMKIKTKSGIQRFQEEENYHLYHRCIVANLNKQSNQVMLSSLKPQSLQMNLLRIVRPMIVTQRASVKVFSFQFTKPLKGKENTQSRKIWFLKFVRTWTTSEMNSTKEPIQLLREDSEREAKVTRCFLS